MMSDYEFNDSYSYAAEYVMECRQMMADSYNYGVYNEIADLIVEYGWDHVKARIDDALNRVNGHE